MNIARKYPSRKNVVDDGLDILIEKKVDLSYLERKWINNRIGYGVFTRTDIARNSLLLIYEGILMREDVANTMALTYEKEKLGCYQFFFKDDGIGYCIDATHSDCLARYVNDSPEKFANCRMKKFNKNNITYLVLVSTTDISSGRELRYDYGDGKNLQWRQNALLIHPRTVDAVNKDNCTKGAMKASEVLKLMIPTESNSITTVATTVYPANPPAVGIVKGGRTVIPEIEVTKEPYMIIRDRSRVDFTRCYKLEQVYTSSFSETVFYCVERKTKTKLGRLFRPLVFYTKIPEIDFSTEAGCPFVVDADDDCTRPQGKEDKGFCECCNIKYASLEKHLNCEEHKSFVSNNENFSKLDGLISTAPSFDSYLEGLKKAAAEKTLNRCGIRIVSCEDNLKPGREETIVDWDKWTDVSSIPSDVLRCMVLDCESELREILNGKRACFRNEQYNCGWKERASLSMLVGFRMFKDDQADLIYETLITLFCTETKYFDYVSKVLWPEAMSLILSKVAKISTEQANKLNLYGADKNTLDDNDESSEDDIIVTGRELLQKNSLTNDNNPQMTDRTNSPEPQNPTEENPQMTDQMNPPEPQNAIEEGNGVVANAQVQSSNVDFTTEVVQSTKSKYLRRQFMCPVATCAKMVFNLPRHLQGKCHNWTAVSAKAAVNHFALRKEHSTSKTFDAEKPRRKDYHSHRICPLDGCFKVVKRLDDHLLNVHKIKADQRYYQLLKSAATYGNPLARVQVVQSPRKHILKIKKASLFSKKRAFKNKIEKAATNIKMLPTSPPKSVVGVSVKEKVNSTDSIYLNDDTSAQTVKVYPRRSCKRKSVIEWDNNSDTTDSNEDSDYFDELADESDDESVVPITSNSDFMETLYGRFLHFLCSPDGGMREKEPAVQVVGDIKRIFTSIGGRSVTDLMDKEMIRDKYLMKYCVERGHAPDSIKKYLYSLEDFCNFILIEEVSVPGKTVENIQQVKILLRSWRKNYNRGSRDRYWERQETDFLMLVTPEQVKMYLEGENAMLAKETFAKLENNGASILSTTDYCAIRDHLLILIHFSNGHRSGVTSNLQLSEYDRVIEVDGSYLIKVRKHKTFSYAGPAIISLDEEQYSLLQLFVANRRTNIVSECNNVFVSSTGKPMTSGAISKQINSQWIKAGIIDPVSKPRNLCCNIIRKSTSTGLRDAKTGCYQEAADLMAHSLKTAEKHYFLREKHHAAAKAGNVIRNHFLEDHSDVPATQSTPPRNHSPVLAEQRSPRHQWHISEVQSITEIFRDEIRQKDISMIAVKDKYPQLTLDGDVSIKQVYDKIRSLMRYTPVKKSLNMAGENFSTTTSNVAHATLTSQPQHHKTDGRRNRRKLFSDNEKYILRTKCENLIRDGPLSRKAVTLALEGEDMLEKYTYMQIRTRLDYERKQL